jgi:hypothetical protein
MALDVLGEVGSWDINNASLVNDASGDATGADEFPEPGCCFGVVLIVIVHSEIL